jgi:esterase/lipase
MIIILLLFIVIYIYIYQIIDELYLEPILLNNKYNTDNLLNIDDKHYAIYEKRNTKRIMLIAKGNHGNLETFNKIFEKIKNIYDYDLLYYEYPGFGLLNLQKANIDNCIEETYFWIKYVKNLNYEIIDFMGFSIGGGIIIESLIKYNINYANNIYLLSTFSCVNDVLYSMNYFNYFLHLFFLKKNNLNICNNLEKTKCNAIYIIHSKDDEIINYYLAIKNYNEIKSVTNTIFIEIFGKHNNPFFNDIKL